MKILQQEGDSQSKIQYRSQKLSEIWKDERSEIEPGRCVTGRRVRGQVVNPVPPTLSHQPGTEITKNLFRQMPRDRGVSPRPGSARTLGEERHDAAVQPTTTNTAEESPGLEKWHFTEALTLYKAMFS